MDTCLIKQDRGLNSAPTENKGSFNGDCTWKQDWAHRQSSSGDNFVTSNSSRFITVTCVCPLLLSLSVHKQYYFSLSKILKYLILTVGCSLMFLFVFQGGTSFENSLL